MTYHCSGPKGLLHYGVISSPFILGLSVTAASWVRPGWCQLHKLQKPLVEATVSSTRRLLSNNVDDNDDHDFDANIVDDDDDDDDESQVCRRQNGVEIWHRGQSFLVEPFNPCNSFLSANGLVGKWQLSE